MYYAESSRVSPAMPAHIHWRAARFWSLHQNRHPQQVGQNRLASQCLLTGNLRYWQNNNGPMPLLQSQKAKYLSAHLSDLIEANKEKKNMSAGKEMTSAVKTHMHTHPTHHTYTIHITHSCTPCANTLTCTIHIHSHTQACTSHIHTTQTT